MPDRKRPAAGETAAGKTGKTTSGSGQTKARGDRTADRAAVRRGTPAGDGPAGGASARVGVRKTYKLFIGGAFPRSESGRSYPAAGPDGAVLAHVAMASRKDARDAVVAARKAVGGLGRGDGVQPGAGPVPGRGTAPGPGRAVHRGIRCE